MPVYRIISEVDGLEIEIESEHKPTWKEIAEERLKARASRKPRIYAVRDMETDRLIKFPWWGTEGPTEHQIKEIFGDTEQFFNNLSPGGSTFAIEEVY
jgi:hypothetical protein